MISDTDSPTRTVTPSHIVERNRRNAAKSTGPRTNEGKDICRGNSVTMIVEIPEEDRKDECPTRLRVVLDPSKVKKPER